MVLEGGAMERSLDHECGAHMSGIGTFKKRSPELPSPFYDVTIQREVCNVAAAPHPAVLSDLRHVELGRIILYCLYTSLWCLVIVTQMD